MNGFGKRSRCSSSEFQLIRSVNGCWKRVGVAVQSSSWSDQWTVVGKEVGVPVLNSSWSDQCDHWTVVRKEMCIVPLWPDFLVWYNIPVKSPNKKLIELCVLTLGPVLSWLKVVPVWATIIYVMPCFVCLGLFTLCEVLTYEGSLFMEHCFAILEQQQKEKRRRKLW